MTYLNEYGALQRGALPIPLGSHEHPHVDPHESPNPSLERKPNQSELLKGPRCRSAMSDAVHVRQRHGASASSYSRKAPGVTQQYALSTHTRTHDARRALAAVPGNRVTSRWSSSQ